MSDSSEKFEDLKFDELKESEMEARAESFLIRMSTRRTVRDFSDRPVSKDIIQKVLSTAGSAPSGANRQPWHFSVVGSPVIKREIRLGAEEEEHEFYNGRAPQEWLDALAPFGTDANKPFLETAPWLIAVFARKFDIDAEGQKHKNYYVTESVGIATGLLLAALHNAGLATLTHTPSPMKFLNKILDRPRTEKPLMLIVVGYPTEDAKVPAITRKSLDQIASFH
ncbi:MAG: nitroreductase family protein [Gammaproteobacteria bacterium]|nr:nitroreductase family protein [Gammaproteobacteria bacterium]